jgi:UTP-glucose-1-phosphate uridylyltransferase
VDETIPTHQNIVYYRLNQLDYNGESELSDVRVVQFKGFGDAPLVAYPNPTRSQVTILLGDDVSQGEYTITDFVGKQWMADIVRAGSKSVELDLSNLPSGVYIATLNSEGNNKHVRIVKQ